MSLDIFFWQNEMCIRDSSGRGRSRIGRAADCDYEGQCKLFECKELSLIHIYCYLMIKNPADFIKYVILFLSESRNIGDVGKEGRNA